MSQYKGRLIVAERSTMDGPEYVLLKDDGMCLINGLTEESAKRLAACWNICEGVSTSLLEHTMSYSYLNYMQYAERAFVKLTTQERK